MSGAIAKRDEATPTIPEALWQQSGRPLGGWLLRAWVGLLFVALAWVLVDITGSVYAWALAALGVVAFFMIPTIVERLVLARQARRVAEVDKGEAHELLDELRGNTTIKLLAPHGWLRVQEGYIHLALGDGRAAARAFAEAERVSTHPGDKAELISAQAHALALAGDRKPARELLAKLAKKDQLSDLDHLNYGVVLLSESGHNSEALEHFEHAREGLGDHPRVVAGLVLALQRCDRTDEAIELLELAEELVDDSDDELAQDLLKRGRKGLRPILKAKKKRERKQAENKRKNKKGKRKPKGKKARKQARREARKQAKAEARREAREQAKAEAEGETQAREDAEAEDSEATKAEEESEREESEESEDREASQDEDADTERDEDDDLDDADDEDDLEDADDDADESEEGEEDDDETTELTRDEDDDGETAEFTRDEDDDGETAEFTRDEDDDETAEFTRDEGDDDETAEFTRDEDDARAEQDDDFDLASLARDALSSGVRPKLEDSTTRGQRPSSSASSSGSLFRSALLDSDDGDGKDDSSEGEGKTKPGSSGSLFDLPSFGDVPKFAPPPKPKPGSLFAPKPKPLPKADDAGKAAKKPAVPKPSVAPPKLSPVAPPSIPGGPKAPSASKPKPKAPDLDDGWGDLDAFAPPKPKPDDED